MKKSTKSADKFDTNLSQWANWQVMVQPVLKEAKAKKAAARAKYMAAIEKAKKAYEAEIAKIDSTRQEAFAAFDSFKEGRDQMKAEKRAARVSTKEEAPETLEATEVVEAPVIEA